VTEGTAMAHEMGQINTQKTRELENYYRHNPLKNMFDINLTVRLPWLYWLSPPVSLSRQFLSSAAAFPYQTYTEHNTECRC